MFDMKNMQNILDRAQQVQENMKESLGSMAFTGTSAGGAVQLVVNGHKEVTKIELEPKAMKNPDLLSDLILAALSDAYTQVDAKLSQDMPAKLENMDLSGIMDMFKP